jgi:hypothetical protein
MYIVLVKGLISGRRAALDVMLHCAKANSASILYLKILLLICCVLF